MQTKSVIHIAAGLLLSCLWGLAPRPTGAAPILLAQPSSRPAQPAQTGQAEAEARSRTAEQFVDFVAEGEFEKARQLMNPVLRDGWSARQMRGDWDNLQKIAGVYQKRLDTEWVDNNLVLVNMQFLRLSDNLLILFDDQGQITGVDFPLQLPRL